MIRLGMANVLFQTEEPEGEDENAYEDEIPRKKHYPMLGQDKGNLNSAVLGRNDTLTLSCYSRPTDKSVVSNFLPVQNVLNRI